MKKILLVAFVAIISTLNTEAQFKVGVIAGRTYSNQARSDASTSKLVSKEAFRGYSIGLVGDWHLSQQIYLQPQLLYTTKGAKYTAEFGTDAKLTMRYVELPVNLLYKHDLSFGKIYVGGGPVVGYNLSGKLENNGQITKLYEGSMNNWNRFEFSATATAGVEFKNGIFAGFKYQRGLNDINKSADIEVKNRLVSYTIGYLVNL